MVQKWNNIDFEVILKLLKESSHLRELGKELRIPHSTLSRKLNILRKNNVLDYKQEGKNKKYFLKKNIMMKKAVMMAEHYKLLKLLSKYPQLEPLFQEILKKSSAKKIIIFGSYAKGTETKTSDLDIYLETKNIEEKKTIEEINHKISVKITKFDEKDLLIKEIIKNHIILKGVDDYYEKVKVFE